MLSTLGTGSSSPAARVEGSTTTRQVKELVAGATADTTAADHSTSRMGKVQHSAATPLKATTSSLRLAMVVAVDAAEVVAKVVAAGVVEVVRAAVRERQRG